MTLPPSHPASPHRVPSPPRQGSPASCPSPQRISPDLPFLHAARQFVLAPLYVPFFHCVTSRCASARPVSVLCPFFSLCHFTLRVSSSRLRFMSLSFIVSLHAARQLVPAPRKKLRRSACRLRFMSLSFIVSLHAARQLVLAPRKMLRKSACRLRFIR